MSAIGETPYEYPRLDYGQNDTASRSALFPGEFSYLRNFYANERGELARRPGCARWLDEDEGSGYAGRGLYQLHSITGVRYQIRFSGTEIHALTSSGSWTDITGTAVLQGGADNLWSITDHYGYLVAVNPAEDYPIIWDVNSGAGFEPFQPANAPEKAGCVFSFAGRLWFGNVYYTANGWLPCFIHHSDIGADDGSKTKGLYKWILTDSYACGPRYGNPVVGGIEKDGVLYVASYPKGTFRVAQTDTSAPYFSVYTYNMDYGCCSGNTFKVAGEWLIFLSTAGDIAIWDTRIDDRRGIRAVTKNSLQKLLKKDVYQSRNFVASGCYMSSLGQYWLTLTEDITRTGTQHNMVLALRIPDSMPLISNIEEAQLGIPLLPAYPYTGWNINYLAEWENAYGQLRPVGVDYYGIVYDLWYGGDDDGEDVTAEANFPLANYGAPGIVKMFNNALLTFSQGEDGDETVNVKHLVDGIEVTGDADISVYKTGVTVDEFIIGISSIGDEGEQDNAIQVLGDGVRSELRVYSKGTKRYGISRVGIGYRPLASPEITD